MENTKLREHLWEMIHLLENPDQSITFQIKRLEGIKNLSNSLSEFKGNIKTYLGNEVALIEEVLKH